MSNDEPVPLHVRRAFACYEKDGTCHHRRFLLPGEPDKPPVCPTHGRMIPQPNKRYFGQPT